MMNGRPTSNVRREMIGKSLALIKWGLIEASGVPRFMFHEDRHGDRAAD